MVRIDVTSQELEEHIRSEYARWSKWADLKPLFLRLQHFKCGYCEAEIGGRPGPQKLIADPYQQDVEHYRPKGQLGAWTPPPEWGPLPIEICDGLMSGYGWLAKNQGNYVASCKSCNESRKKSYFPVRARLADYVSEPDIDGLKAEGPYLIFPFGFLEAMAPEEMIMFVGADAHPHSDWDIFSLQYWRARITIEILGLNRADLRIPRLSHIAELAAFLKYSAVGRASSEWDEALRARGDRSAPFSSCTQCFVQLHQQSPIVAARLGREAMVEIGRHVEANILWPIESSSTDM